MFPRLVAIWTYCLPTKIQLLVFRFTEIRINELKVLKLSNIWILPHCCCLWLSNRTRREMKNIWDCRYVCVCGHNPCFMVCISICNIGRDVKCMVFLVCITMDTINRHQKLSFTYLCICSMSWTLSDQFEIFKFSNHFVSRRIVRLNLIVLDLVVSRSNEVIYRIEFDETYVIWKIKFFFSICCKICWWICFFGDPNVDLRARYILYVVHCVIDVVVEYIYHKE